jgi:heme exporter protein C
VTLFFSLAILLAILAPKEKTLGNYVKLVYLHAAITWVGLLLFTAAALAGLIYLVKKDSRYFRFSYSTQINALWFWLGSVILGTLNMKLIWGGILWAEPKFVTAIILLVLSFIGYYFSKVSENIEIKAGINLALGLFVWVSLSIASRIFHPGRAILSSPSLEIKVFAGLITLSILLAAILLVRLSWPAESTSLLAEKGAPLLKDGSLGLNEGENLDG